MRVLVTGGFGFVGRWLAAHLESCGDEVVVTGEEVDVRDPVAVRASLEAAEPDAVYHLAGLASVGASWEEPGKTFAVNTVGTVNVLDGARRLANPPRVLVVSSAEVYGRVSEADLPLGEARPLRPVSPYAASKVAAEVAAGQAYAAFGLGVVVARPFNHIGPGQSPAFVVSALARRIVEARRAGRPTVEMGNPSARRDLTDVRDVVRAYRLLIERGDPGEPYNVCSGRDVRIGDLAERLLELSGGGLELVTGAVDVRAVEIPVLRGDPSRIEAATGWRPSIQLDETLVGVLEHWQREIR